MSSSIKEIRNVAIIAHVDHGKTTLVDALLSQSGIFRDNEVIPTCVMDSNDLERERGITILSKNTAVNYKETRINIIDTPGHADFGGEVERVLGMVDGCLLIVDANEGPMPQTRFVLKKALEKGLRPIVFVNKIDRPRVVPEIAIDKVLDLFLELGADDDQCDFPYLFGSGLSGFAKEEMESNSDNMMPLFEAIIRHVPPPVGDANKPLQLQITTLDYSDFLGRIVIGKIHNGTIKNGQQASLIKENGKTIKGKVSKLLGFEGLQRIDINEAFAGDIVAVSGFDDVNIGETIACPDSPHPLPLIKVDEPTLNMTFVVNDSPFAGKEGKFVTSRQLKNRLERELLTNVALRVEETDSPDRFSVSGRGELHLSILIENMRREGFEIGVSSPDVIYKNIDGEKCEPFEDLILDIEEQHQGVVIEKLGERKAKLVNLTPFENNKLRLNYEIPTRGLIGFRSEFLTLTSGTGIINHTFKEYKPCVMNINRNRKNGALISMSKGKAVPYALFNLQERGKLIIPSNVEVYEGMIIGFNSRENDLTVNPLKTKQLTNFRASGADEAIILTPETKITLEKAIEMINEDELIEVTPKEIRLRKRYLKEHERKKDQRSKN